jgi:hypothetical protein
MGPKEDPELQRQIEANEGIFEPLLAEPHPDFEEKLRIIDGDRRWTNSKILVEVQKKEQYRSLPVEVTDHTLSDEERLRIWIYIHRQRKEWDAKEKEMVAYSLVSMVGRASAANILGITVRELDKLSRSTICRKSSQICPNRVHRSPGREKSRTSIENWLVRAFLTPSSAESTKTRSPTLRIVASFARC